MGNTLIDWTSDPSETPVVMSAIEHFDARGMRRVYGRNDHFGRHRSFNMDIWETRNGRILMRCWSRCEDIDWHSFEIKGVDTAKIPKHPKGEGFDDSWIPGMVRQAYDQWINEEY